MKLGWQQIGGQWYYLNGNGEMTIGWQFVGGRWYYMGGNGVMYANTWTHWPRKICGWFRCLGTVNEHVQDRNVTIDEFSTQKRDLGKQLKNHLQSGNNGRPD